MKKVVRYICIMIANAILIYRGITLMTWEWWAIMISVVGWSVLIDE
jgi:hypothetical protein